FTGPEHRGVALGGKGKVKSGDRNLNEVKSGRSVEASKPSFYAFETPTVGGARDNTDGTVAGSAQSSTPYPRRAKPVIKPGESTSSGYPQSHPSRLMPSKIPPATRSASRALDDAGQIRDASSSSSRLPRSPWHKHWL